MGKAFSFKILMPMLIGALLLAFLFTRASDESGDKTVSANFPRAVSIYVGTDVRILGVTVGRVTSVTPEGASVRVAMSYDVKYDLPSDAKAVIVTPTLVADRFIQLTPVYTQGDTMADGADIALPDTAVPVELDRIYAALNDLATTLGPNGVNKDGTLNHLVEASARALDGQGKRGNEMLRNLAAAAQTFGNNSGDLFETVSQLARFTTTLGENDQLVRAFVQDLAGVSSQLAGERQEIQQLLGSVADAVGTVEGFVKNNRQALVTDVEKLTRVMTNINSEKSSIDTALKIAPVAIGNLFLAYNTESGSIGSRIGVGDGRTPGVPSFRADAFLCSVVQQSGIPPASKSLACQLFKALLEPAENALPTGPLGSTPLPVPGINQRPATTKADRPHVPVYSSEQADLSTLLGGAR